MSIVVVSEIAERQQVDVVGDYSSMSTHGIRPPLVATSRGPWNGSDTRVIPFLVIDRPNLRKWCTLDIRDEYDSRELDIALLPSGEVYLRIANVELCIGCDPSPTVVTPATQKGDGL